MSRTLRLFFGLVARSVRSRRNLLLENVALRQQLAILKERHPQPRFRVSGQALLDVPEPILARMETGLGTRPARDGHSVASGRVQAVLDVALAASEVCGQKMCEQGSA